MNYNINIKNKLFANTITSILYQFIAVICGFILPRMILIRYGSETNGLLLSIMQFLAVISFLELGVGAVIQSKLFKPLSVCDWNKVSDVIVAGDKFYKKIAYYLIIYVCFITIIFPYIYKGIYSPFEIITLVLILSVSTFFQYYFGIMDNILLVSDEKGYIIYISHTITILANIILGVILMWLGCSIHVVKLVSGVVFLCRPLVIRKYVNSLYKINRLKNINIDPIKQKWDGVWQHVAHIILEHTDVIVLTILANVVDVSIYAVYNLVIYGVKNLYLTSTQGVLSYFGKLWVSEDQNRIFETFKIIEFSLHCVVVFLFTCTAVLICPFINIYTKGVDDAVYYQPIFAIIIVFANAMHCIRIPYHIVIKAAGEFKNTKKCFVNSAILNILLSVVGVKVYGLLGVAFGTLAAMSYQTIWLVIYNSKKLMKWPIKCFLKQILFDLFMITIIILITDKWNMNDITYSSWIILAIKVALTSISIILLGTVLFYRHTFSKLLTYQHKI